MSLKEIAGKIFFQLKHQALKGRIVSIQHLRELQEDIEKHRKHGLFDDEFYRECLTEFVYSLPENLSKVRSLIVVAAPQPQFQVTFNWNGESHSFIIPPTYLVYSDRQVEDLLTEILGPEKYLVAKASLPKKLLTVRSGLARYGKNNICYVPGMGSFHRLTAFYSDLPCPEDIWQEAQMMEECSNCSACLRGCPTGAISSDRFLLHAERCITFHNERASDFPKWIKPRWHNALIGCLYCQRVCPLNKPFLRWIENKSKFSEEETALLLKRTPLNRLSAVTIKKLKEIDWVEDLDLLGRNLRALLKKSRKL